MGTSRVHKAETRREALELLREDSLKRCFRRYVLLYNHSYCLSFKLFLDDDCFLLLPTACLYYPQYHDYYGYSATHLVG